MCKRSQGEVKQSNIIFNDCKLKKLIEVKMEIDRTEKVPKRKSLRRDLSGVDSQQAKSLALLKLQLRDLKQDKTKSVIDFSKISIKQPLEKYLVPSDVLRKPAANVCMRDVRLSREFRRNNSYLQTDSCMSGGNPFDKQVSRDHRGKTRTASWKNIADDIVVSYSQIDKKEPDQRFSLSTKRKGESVFDPFDAQPTSIDTMTYDASHKEVLSTVSRSNKVSIDFGKQLPRSQQSNLLSSFLDTDEETVDMKKGSFVKYLPNTVLRKIKKKHKN